jgi:hypothetical protein
MSAYDPGTWDIFGDIAAINRWLDQANASATYDDDATRVMKVSEEIGEFIEALMLANGRAAAAYIGLTGQNPRKGQTHTIDDVNRELADITVTALCAIQHFTGNKSVTRAVLAAKIAGIMARGNIVPADDMPPYDAIHGPTGDEQCYMSPCPYHPEPVPMPVPPGA